MSRSGERISEILHQAAETHHIVYAIVDGADDDWASWYADWMLELSTLADELGAKPVRSHLVHELVNADQAFVSGQSAGRWEDVYAQRLIDRFGVQ